MSLFNKNIVILCLSKEGLSLALKVNKNKAGLELLSSNSFNNNDYSSLQDKLELSANDYVVFCDDGSLSLNVCLPLPKLSEKELCNAVSFELGSKIPLAVGDVKWGYSRESNICHLNIISSKAWDEIILKTRGINFDFFMSSSSLPELSEQVKDLAKANKLEAESALWEPALKVASFCVSHDMNLIKKTMLKPALERRLKHRFLSKYLMVACLTYVLVSLVMIGVTYFKDKSHYADQLQSRINQIEAATPHIDEASFEYLNEVNDDFLSLVEKTYSPADLLDEIALRLPEKYLIKSIRTDGLTVNCELTSQDGVLDTKEIYTAFVTSDFFTKDIPISQRKGSLQLNLTLNKKGVTP